VEYEDQISIATPEGLALTLTLAGLGSRAIATMLDWCIRAPILVIVVVVAAGSAIGDIVVILTLFVLIYVYDVLFEAYGGGRTPGKRLTSLRVMHVDGRPEGLGTAAVRNIIRIVDFLPSLYIVGSASVITTAKNQRLGDIAAGTVVVREPRVAKPAKPPKETHRVPPPRPAAPATPTADGLPAWDVTAVTATDLAAVRTFLERRTVLTAAARVDLGQRLAAGLASKIPGLDGATPGDPEELLEIVAALKQARGR
jgi:uncharacterized RDD family membrane protein YckC